MAKVTQRNVASATQLGPTVVGLAVDAKPDGIEW